KHLDVSVRAESESRVTAVEVAVNDSHWRRAARDPHTGLYSVRINVQKWQGEFVGLRARAKTVTGVMGESGSQYLALDGVQAQRPEAVAQDRALWVWERASYAVVFDRTERDKLAAVMDDTTTFDSDAVRTIYLGVDR